MSYKDLRVGDLILVYCRIIKKHNLAIIVAIDTYFDNKIDIELIDITYFINGQIINVSHCAANQLKHYGDQLVRSALSVRKV